MDPKSTANSDDIAQNVTAGRWNERRAELEKEAEESTFRLPETLLALGTVAMAQGDQAAARAALVKSSQAWQRKRILNEDPPLDLGILLWQLGEPDEARVYLEWSLESRFIAGLRQGAGAHPKWITGDASRSYPGDPDVPGALEALAWVAAEAGQADRALELAGAASALKEERPPSPSDTFVRSRVDPSPADVGWEWRWDDWLASERQKLGAAAEAAWNQGRQLSPLQAVRIALGREPSSDLRFWDEAPFGLDPAASGLHSATLSALVVVVLDILLVFFVGPHFGLGGPIFLIAVIVGSSFLWAGWHLVLLEMSQREQARRRAEVTAHVAEQLSRG